jgi:hypothetical protein
MKSVLIVLSIFVLIGLISATFITGELELGIQDASGGIFTMVILWSIYLIYKGYKK